MDLAQTLWIAFDKKQPDYPEMFKFWTQEIEKQNRRKKSVFHQSMSIHESTRIAWDNLVEFNNHFQKIVTIEMLVAMKDGEVLDEFTIHTNTEMECCGDFDGNGHCKQVCVIAVPIQTPIQVQNPDYQQAMESVLYHGFEIKPDQTFKNLYSMDGEKMIISDFKGEPITLNWWKEVLK